MLALSDTGAQAVTINSAFTTGAQQPIAISRDPGSGDLFIYNRRQTDIEVRATDGTLLRTIPRPGVISQDVGLDFIGGNITLNGTNVGAGNLLMFNGDNGPEEVFAIDPATGTVLASRTLPSQSLVGGTFHEDRGSLFTVDFQLTKLVREIDADTGLEINSFSAQTPDFDIFFGGIDVAPNGNLLLVSDQQPAIREVTPTGALVRDIDLTGLAGFGCGMTGIHVDDPTGNVWVTCTTTVFNNVFELTDLAFGPPMNPVPLPAAVWFLGSGLLGLAGIGVVRRRVGAA